MAACWCTSRPLQSLLAFDHCGRGMCVSLKVLAACCAALLVVGCAGESTKTPEQIVWEKLRSLRPTGADFVGPGRCANEPTQAVDARDRDLAAAAASAISFIHGNTQYSKINTPCVIWARKEEVMARETATPAPEGSQFSRTAVYYCRTFTVHVREDLAPLFRHPFGVSVLIHEFVHHGQCLDNRLTKFTACEFEHEAYSVQAGYLRQQAAAATNAQESDLLERLAASSLSTARQFCPSRT
jgi:hypothetical protein